MHHSLKMALRKKAETCRCCNFELCFNCIYIMKVVLDCKIIYILLIKGKHNGDASPENKNKKIIVYPVRNCML